MAFILFINEWLLTSFTLTKFGAIYSPSPEGIAQNSKGR